MLMLISILEVGRYELSAGYRAVHGFEYNPGLRRQSGTDLFCRPRRQPIVGNELQGTAADDRVNIGPRMILQ